MRYSEAAMKSSRAESLNPFLLPKNQKSSKRERKCNEMWRSEREDWRDS